MALTTVHLPPGHQPGPQSRRKSHSAPFGPILLGLFAIGMLGGAIYLFVTRHSGSRSGHEVGAAIFAAFGLLALVFALYLWRRVFGGGPRARGVQLRVAQTEFRRGEQVSVEVTVNPARVGERELQVGLVCTQFTDVKRQRVDQNGYSHDVRVTEPSDVIADWHEVPHGTTSQSFSFPIPQDGPFSYEGAAVSFAYRVSAREPRRMRSDPHRDVPIWVRP